MGTIYGTTGNDNITATSPGGDTVVAYDGNDTVTGSGSADLIYGNQGDDVLVGGYGNDTLVGGLGNDIIYGNQDNDTIYGNEGNDIIYGGLGNDYVQGDDGNDQLVGNEGSDFLVGGNGDDVVLGNQDNDSVYGQMGNDTLYGGLGDDLAVGGQGNDVVYGNEGNDTLYGNEGADTLSGGDGYDIVQMAGTYNDYAFGRDTSGNLIVTDTRGNVAGNEGRETITRDTETIRFSDGVTVNIPALADQQLNVGTRNVYAIGDSITEGAGNGDGPNGNIATSWPAYLDALRSSSVYNAGIAGAVATAGGKTVLQNGVPITSTQSIAGDVWDSGGTHGGAGGSASIASYVGGGHGGDVAIIMIGRNDISGGFANNGGTYNQANVIAAIDDMVNDARANGNHFLVSSVLLRSNEGTNGTDPNFPDANPENRPIGRAQVLALNAELSARYGDAFVDTNAAMMAANPSGDGTIASAFFTDTVHPTTSGASQIGSFMNAELNARGW